MKVLLTGAEGFVGGHVRTQLWARGGHRVTPVGRSDWHRLPELAAGVDAVLHVAGVNRGDPGDVEQQNVRLATDVADALHASGNATARVVYAGTVHAGSDTPYGRGKAAAADVLATAAARGGGSFVDVRLPNLFGEHGRPRYNSFVATFVDAVVRGESPEVVDRPVHLVHVRDAAGALADALVADDVRVPGGVDTTVEDVLRRLRAMERVYRHAEIPDLSDPFDRDLFNTLRAASFRSRAPLRLIPRSDARGRLVEGVRSHGGQGQTFVSTTREGVVRGEHVHLRKVERFVVVAGRARIRLRRLFTPEVVTLDVTGDDPVAVDMPTGWTHDLTNTGDGDLTTLFWVNELYDPADPDTYPVPVVPAEGRLPEEDPC